MKKKNLLTTTLKYMLISLTLAGGFQRLFSEGLKDSYPKIKYVVPPYIRSTISQNNIWTNWYGSIKEDDPVCTVGVNGSDFGWYYAGGSTTLPVITHTITQPAANYGFVLDIFGLDNSFNMEINGVQLANQEIEFYNVGQNIRFADGTLYGINTNSIWNIIGNESHPLIRINISPTGAITMQGSKVSGGSLYPLVLTNGNTFNTIHWNVNSSNTIIAKQNVIGQTLMRGRGYGLNTAPCFCVKPGTIGAPDQYTKVGILTKLKPTIINWPEIIPNGHIALDSDSKGFVITHMTTSQRDALIALDGMLIYNTDLRCVQLYRGLKPGKDLSRVGWNCLTRGCNE